MTNTRLKSVRIRNFKQFIDVTFELDSKKNFAFNKEVLTTDERFVKTALLVGRNGGGKTDLGLAIMDITFHITDTTEGFERYNNYLNAESGNPYATFTFTFDIDKQSVVYEYTKRTVTQCLTEKFVIDDQLVFFCDHNQHVIQTQGAQTWGFKDLRFDKFQQGQSSLLKGIHANSLLSEENPITQVVRFVEGMRYVRPTGDQWYVIGGERPLETKVLDDLIKMGDVSALQQFFNNAGIHENLTVLNESTGDHPRLYFVRTNKNLAFTEVASSGIKALAQTFYCLKCLTDQKHSWRFLYLDDFDAFYHAETARLVFRALRDQVDGQCVLTTHRTHLLSHRDGRCDAFYVVTPDYVTAFSERTEREIREGNNVERLYLGGEFD